MGGLKTKDVIFACGLVRRAATGSVYTLGRHTRPNRVLWLNVGLSHAKISGKSVQLPKL